MAEPMANHISGRDQQFRYDIGALEQRVTGTEKAFNDLSKQIAAVDAKLDERSRTPWVTLIAAGGFLLAFMSTIGVLAYGPMERGLERHQAIIDRMEARYVRDLKDEIKLLRSNSGALARPSG